MNRYKRVPSHESKDFGKKYEDEVARIIGKLIKITSRGKVYYKNGRRFCETDIETKSSAIEVKSGRGNDMLSQLNRYSQVTKKEPIGFGKKLRLPNKREIRKRFKLFEDEDSLTDYLVSKGDGKRWRKK
ncbi:MAG: hypothetical protein LKJ88_05730 [Bacilli bacterium]|jgi:hypothetical protein|nr:hypothetical protein [Bacilli bacterium]